MGAKFIDVLGSVVVVGGILVMTRPGSQGPNLIGSFFQGFSGLLGTAVGASAGAATTSVLI